MNNYIPARLTLLSEQEPNDLNDDVDYNEEIDRMIQDRIDFAEFENDIYEREEGIES